MATDPASVLLQRLRAAREYVVELGDGRRLRARRPLASQLMEFRAGLTPERLASLVIGWDGVTEADVLGPALGSQEPAAFSAEVCVEVLGDRADWMGTLAEQTLRVISEHIAAQEAAAKN